MAGSSAKKTGKVSVTGGIVYAVDALTLLRNLPDNSLHCIVTSPPYYGSLRRYGIDPIKWADGWTGDLGCESSPEQYVVHMMEIMDVARAKLHPSGTMFFNIGDTYAGSGKGVTNNDAVRNRVMERHIPRTRNDSPLQGHTYGLKRKDLLGVPWMCAFALRASGWYLRQELIWAKGMSGETDFVGNPKPHSVKDRCLTTHEHVFLLSKSEHYFFDHAAIRGKSPKGTSMPWGNKRQFKDNGQRWGKTGMFAGGSRERYLKWYGNGHTSRSVWCLPTEPYKGCHTAAFPVSLPERCIKAGTSPWGCCSGCATPLVEVRPHCRCGEPVTPCLVLDPFAGSGTTGEAALSLGRHFIGAELNRKHLALCHERMTLGLEKLAGVK